MKTLLLPAAAVLALGFAPQAEAARFSAVNGSKLVELCTSRDAKMANSCTAYIEGVSDSLSLIKEVGAQRGGSGTPADAVCVPGEVTGLRQRDTVVADALREAYACR